MSQGWQEGIKSQQRTLEQLKAQDAALNQDQIAADIEKVLTQKSNPPSRSRDKRPSQPIADEENDVVDIYGTKPSMSSFYVQKGVSNPLLESRSATKRADSPTEELPAPVPAGILGSPSSPPSEALNQLTKETQDRYVKNTMHMVSFTDSFLDYIRNISLY